MRLSALLTSVLTPCQAASRRRGVHVQVPLTACRFPQKRPKPSSASAKLELAVFTSNATKRETTPKQRLSTVHGRRSREQRK